MPAFPPSPRAAFSAERIMYVHYTDGGLLVKSSGMAPGIARRGRCRSATWRSIRRMPRFRTIQEGVARTGVSSRHPGDLRLANVGSRCPPWRALQGLSSGAASATIRTYTSGAPGGQMTNRDEWQPRPLAPLLTPKVVGQHLSVSTATGYRLIARRVGGAPGRSAVPGRADRARRLQGATWGAGNGGGRGARGGGRMIAPTGRRVAARGRRFAAESAGVWVQ